MSFNNKLFGVVGVGAGLLALNYIFSTFEKMHRISKKLDSTIDDMAESTEIDISERLVASAVDKAVEKEVGRAVKCAVDDVIRTVKNDIRTEVKTSVNAVYFDIKASVTKEVSRQVGEIDIDDIREDVIERAKEAVLEKFDGSLDDILTKFNGDLDNVNKIYSSIARAITDRSSNGTIFRIS